MPQAKLNILKTVIKAQTTGQPVDGRLISTREVFTAILSLAETLVAEVEALKAPAVPVAPVEPTEPAADEQQG